ncbi:MAG: hypothetical protein LBJ35_02460 [Spirochaetaceae bacterium]|jgi:hypothetical protein|nr:hypothetical protein [Spirochaetaceae bacterium]
MNTEVKLECTGLFPTYLNLSSSSTKFQIQDDATARLIDFSSCNTTAIYVAKQEPIPVKQHITYR